MASKSLPAETTPRPWPPQGVNAYYVDEAVCLIQGDCLDVLPTLAQVDHVITDPPYSNHVHGKQRRGGAHRGAVVSSGRELGFVALTAELRRAVAMEMGQKASRWSLAFSDVESASDWRCDMEAAGLEYVRTGAWVKLGATPQFTGDRPAPGFEVITIGHPAGKKRWNGGGSHAVWTHPILNGSTVPRDHTTQKPESLMRELVTLFTDPGETILDPFAGSGTTLVAAKRLGRKAIGIELNPAYCDVIVSRLRQGSLLSGEVA